MQLTLELHPLSERIRLTRETLGLGRTEFANLLGMNSFGERTIRGWEIGEHIPSQRKLDDIALLEEYLAKQRGLAPFRRNKRKKTNFY